MMFEMLFCLDYNQILETGAIPAFLCNSNKIVKYNNSVQQSYEN